MKSYSLILFSLIASALAHGQLNEAQIARIDSLKGVYQSNVHDSLRINALFAWDDMIYNFDPKLDLKLNQQIDSLCRINLKKKSAKKEKLYFENALIKSLNAQGIIYMYAGESELAVKYYEEALALSVKTNRKERIAALNNNLGIMAYRAGKLPEAIHKYTAALRVLEETGDTAAAAGTINNIAQIYSELGEDEKSLEYYQKALIYARKSGHTPWEATAIEGQARWHRNHGDKEIGRSLLIEALKLHRKSNYLQGIIGSFGNIGEAYLNDNYTDSAFVYLDSALILAEQFGEPRLKTVILSSLAVYYLRIQNLKQAEYFALQSLDLGKKLNLVAELKKSSEVLYTVYKKTGRLSQAIEMLELNIALRDSILTQNNLRNVIQQEYQYHYQKQALQDSLKSVEQKIIDQAEIDKRDVEIRANKRQAIILYTGLAIVLVFAVFIFNRFRVTRRQKFEIEAQRKIAEEQRKLVETKNHEILDSINYAKRIQAAILPPLNW